MKPLESLPPEALCQRCDPDLFDFSTTDELEPLVGTMGQPRAVEAVQFGVGIEQEGYNIFALGPAGTDKRNLVEQSFHEAAASEDAPEEWVYVHNFSESHKPNAIALPAGRGAKLRDDIEQLIEDLRTALSSAFEGEEYRSRIQEIQQELRERQEAALEDLRQKAEERDMAMLRTPAGLAFAPTKEGEVISPEEFQELSDEVREKVKSETPELQEELQKILQQVPQWQREMRKRIDDLNREMADFAVGALIDELREKYADLPEVVEHLNAVQDDIVRNVRQIVAAQEGDDEAGRQDPRLLLASQASPLDTPALRRYRVNLLVDHSTTEGAPVVYEDNPTYQNLIGRIEHTAQLGALITDFNLIKPGALHRANGGYLILEARNLLMQPFAWEGLKRALRSRQLRIESPGQLYSLISTVSLEPEPIPIDLKVALLGEPILYYLLSELEPEFPELFKVAADFDSQMDRNGENQVLYARMLATIARRNELRPFNRAAVARVIEQSARMAGDGEKLSARTRAVADLLREADYWAQERQSDVVAFEDVEKAIDASIYRSDRIRERIQEQILRDILLIDTEGERVGQVNGLSLLALGEFSFGRPNRISAQVRLGKGEVVDIEREVELGGPIHSKGVFILSAFLGARYSHERPLSLSASLVFEQSYAGVEGDSASSAELYALLSAVSGLPIRQTLAVTGSVNQHGEVQAIGGVNEKVEGFFDLCNARGLTGEQGVLIPASNVKHLMLRDDVVEAVKEGMFSIYPIHTIDEGIEILTGTPAGEPDLEGEYPPDSVNGRVQTRLREMAANRRRFDSGTESTDGDA
jgi:lon-related putative ATP-dependent protease